MISHRNDSCRVRYEQPRVGGPVKQLGVTLRAAVGEFVKRSGLG